MKEEKKKQETLVSDQVLEHRRAVILVHLGLGGVSCVLLPG